MSNNIPQKPDPLPLDELRRWRALGQSTGRLEALGIKLPDAPELPEDVLAAFEAGRKAELKKAAKNAK